MTNEQVWWSGVKSRCPELEWVRVGGTWLQLMCCAILHHHVPNFRWWGQIGDWRFGDDFVIKDISQTRTTRRRIQVVEQEEDLRDKCSERTMSKISRDSVMSWDRKEGVPRFYMFGEDSASANVLCHQTSTVLEFWARDRRGFRGLDKEFKGQSMSISDWGTYMRFGTYMNQRGSCQGSENWAYIGVGVRGNKNRTRGIKMQSKMETWNMKGNVFQGWMSKQSDHDAE